MVNFQDHSLPQAPQDKLIVALDCSEEKALAIADILQGQALWFKVGMTLFYEAGPRIVRELKERGFKVFLDLKLHDIPHQVRGAARSISRLGVDMLSCHASGGAAMLEAVREGLSEVQNPYGSSCALLAITVLTSFDEQTLADIGIERGIDQQVELLARLSRSAQGVVCSPHEAKNMRALLGAKALVVTPGVRPALSDCEDQSRVLTPSEALREGASQLVVGRPICQSQNILASFQRIIKEIEGEGV